MAFLPLDSRAGDGRFQIVATLGPSSLTQVGAMAEAGATAFRLNASHLRPSALRLALQALGAAAGEAPVVVDLQGAKMRLGWIAERPVEPGARVRLSVDGRDGLALPHPELFRAVEAGEVLEVDDGRIQLLVEARGEGWIDARALGPGTLRPRKGVNRRQHPVALEGLSESDREAIAVTREAAPRAAFAFSFAVSGYEVGWLRAVAPAATVLVKIERPEAVERIAALGAGAGALWICRGDLGVQMGLGPLARWLSSFVPAPDKPTLMAGQVLEHLTAHGEPTRSEVCHLGDVLARGYAGIVLSDETAIGHDPVGAVAWAARLAREIRG